MLHSPTFPENVRRNSLDCPETILGLSGDSPWNLSGILRQSLESPWTVHGICLESLDGPWKVRGQSREFVQNP